MPDTSYEYLTSRGWEWLFNCSGDVAHGLISDYMFNDMAEFCHGMPKRTPKYSSEQLKLMGMVGVYRRGDGGRPVKCISDPPPQPFFVDSPGGPTYQKPKRPGQATDQPPVETITAGCGW